MIYGSVCSGIESASVAWHHLGWDCAFVSEIEPFPRAVLAHQFPHFPLHGDFTTIRAGDYQNIDLLVGGTPCQGFSLAGARCGLYDDRSNLALQYIRLLAHLRPRWFVWENVPGCLSTNGGRDFGTILTAMAELGFGIAYRVLDAQFFGVPQRRRRVFIVGHSGGEWQRAAAVLFDPESLRGHLAPSRSAQEIVTALTANGVGAGGGADDNAAQGGHLIADFMANQRVAGTLMSSGAGMERPAGMASETDFLVLSSITGNPISVAPTLDARAADGPRRNQEQVLIAFSCKDDGRDASDISPTLRGMVHSGSHPNDGGQVAVDMQSAVRRLTPRECERLQGFPDDYTLVPVNAKGKMSSDGPRYRALGNSMCVNVMQWIGERIDLIDRITI